MGNILYRNRIAQHAEDLFMQCGGHLFDFGSHDDFLHTQFRQNHGKGIKKGGNALFQGQVDPSGFRRDGQPAVSDRQ